MEPRAGVAEYRAQGLRVYRGRNRVIFSAIVNRCWTIFKSCLALTLVGGVVAGVLLYLRMDEELRARIEAKFASKYPNLTVRVRSARLLAGEGIEIRGLSISVPGDAGPHGQLAYIDEIFLACSTDLGDLAHGEPPVTQITIRRPVVHAARRADGTWSAAQLLPFPKFGKRAPVCIQNGLIEIIEPARHPVTNYSIRDINCTIKPQPSLNGETEGPLEIQGSASADHLARIAIGARVDPASHRWAVQGALSALHLAPELLVALPEEFAAAVPALRPIRGEGQIDFQVWGDPSATQPIVFKASAELSGGRFEDPRLPYPLSDLHARLTVDNSGFTLEELTARNGPTSLRLIGKSEGLTPASPMNWFIEGKHLQMNKQWTNALPESLKETWNKFLPAGEIDITARLAFDGQKWQPVAVAANLIDTSFSYHKFPYRLEHGTGKMLLDHDKLSMRLAAFAGAERVEIDGELLHPGPHFTGRVQLRGDGIPFDRTLLAALPGKSRDVLAALNPYGTFNFVCLVTRDNPNVEGVNQQLLITLNRCAVKYDKFAYPIGNIRGTVQLENGRWTFSGLQGNNHTGLITCSGDFQPIGDGDSQLRLNFKGQEIQLDDELRDSLAASEKQLWNSIKPRGAINLNADVSYLNSQKKVDLTLHVEPVGDSTYIEPRCFPYRLEKLQGALDYHQGHVQFEKMRAVHDRTTISTAGACDILPEGGWQLQLKRLSVDRLKADRDLIAALPPKLRKAVTELAPTGPLNLRGDVTFTGSAKPELPPSANWDLQLDMQQGSVNCGSVKIDNIFGGVRLVGSSDGLKSQSRGELAVDSLTYRDLQLTEVRGPLWFDDQRVLLGVEAEQKAFGRGSRRVTGKFYGGVLLADGTVTLQTTPRFSVRATLSDADLEKFAGESVPGKQKLKGKVLATVELSGTSAGVHTLLGGGAIHLRQADIYELPLMVALLKILSVRTPDSTAFVSSDMDFRIDGEHMYFDRIVMAGDAISLLGKGELGIDGEIKLAFHSMVGRPEFQIPIVKTVLGQASKQILLIHIDGTLSNPKTSTEVLPTINQALQALQGEGVTPLPPVEGRAAVTDPRAARQ